MILNLFCEHSEAFLEFHAIRVGVLVGERSFYAGEGEIDRGLRRVVDIFSARQRTAERGRENVARAVEGAGKVGSGDVSVLADLGVVSDSAVTLTKAHARDHDLRDPKLCKAADEVSDIILAVAAVFLVFLAKEQARLGDVRAHGVGNGAELLHFVRKIRTECRVEPAVIRHCRIDENARALTDGLYKLPCEADLTFICEISRVYGVKANTLASPVLRDW